MMYFEKSQPAPTQLAVERDKISGTYLLDEVLGRLVEDFKNKCYICEQKAPTNINVEHFKPHKGDISLKFDWDNLFLSCGHCNNTKLDKYDPMLNCTDASDEVEKKLKYYFNYFAKEKITIEALDKTVKTANTKDLLLAVFNGTTMLKRLESYNLRKALSDQLGEFESLLNGYFNGTNSADDMAYFERKIRQHLDKGSAFTSFKRWIVLEDSEYKQVFEKYFN